MSKTQRILPDLASLQAQLDALKAQNEALSAKLASKSTGQVSWNTDGYVSKKTGQHADAINISGNFWPSISLTPAKAAALAFCLDDKDFRKALVTMSKK